MDNKTGRIILSLTIPLSILVAVASCMGILTPDFYASETRNWQIQSVGQDEIDLFMVVPVLIITAIFSYQKKFIAGLLWAGVVAYILYTFIIYCFAIHFNRLFIIYCSILGLSFCSLEWFIYSLIKDPFTMRMKKNIFVTVTGIYFIVVSLAFYLLWVSEIVPAIINKTIPKGLAETGLFTNPVQVIDLSVFLPAVFITGLFVLKRKLVGFLFAIIILTFFILMNITIGWLSFTMMQKGLESNLSITIIMAALTLISIAFLIWNIKNIKIEIA